MKGVQSKVAAWPVLTLIEGQNIWDGDSWSSHIGNTIGVINPFMMLHAVYGVFDPDIYKVDLKVKVRIDAVIPTSNQSSLSNIANITFSAGKVSVFKLNELSFWESKKTLETGYMAFPIKGKVFSTDITKFPTNVVVTIVEDNDFGDVVGKGAKLIGDKKDGITDIFE